MPQNLEIKARVSSLRLAFSVCKRIKAERKGLLRQTDTYFNVNRGRLKLREINGKKFELIYYTRSARKGTRYSDYTIVPLIEPGAMKSLCAALFGVKSVVSKQRTLFLFRNARIHIDRVKGLGSFIEFEVIVSDGKKQASQLMDFLITEFGISSRQTIGGSYADMQ